MTLRLRILNKSEFDKNINLSSQKVLQNIKRAVRISSNQVRNEAVTSITQNPRAGNTVTRYDPKRTIKISKEGDPPASDTGFLASNIHLIVDGDGMGASVESRAKYSAFLEFGTRDMMARPFMQPALEKGRRKYREMFKKAVMDGI
jgi:HK97 gp10 family phage protein